MRRFATLFRLVSYGLALGACADAPVTQDQLDAAGALRGGQATFSVGVRAAPEPASVVQLELALSGDATASQNTSTVSGDGGQVVLHARAAGLTVPRPTWIRWIHGDQSFESQALLVGGDAWSELATLELAPHQVGPWIVEVLAEPSSPGEPAEVLVSREFSVS